MVRAVRPALVLVTVLALLVTGFAMPAAARRDPHPCGGRGCDARAESAGQPRGASAQPGRAHERHAGQAERGRERHAGQAGRKQERKEEGKEARHRRAAQRRADKARREADKEARRQAREAAKEARRGSAPAVPGGPRTPPRDDGARVLATGVGRDPVPTPPPPAAPEGEGPGTPEPPAGAPEPTGATDTTTVTGTTGAATPLADPRLVPIPGVGGILDDVLDSVRDVEVPRPQAVLRPFTGDPAGTVPGVSLLLALLGAFLAVQRGIGRGMGHVPMSAPTTWQGLDGTD